MTLKRSRRALPPDRHPSPGSPAALVPLAAAAVDTCFSRLTGRSPRVPLEGARMARHRMFFDSRKAVEALGLPQTPVGEALARAVAWFRANGYVRG